MWAWGVGDGVYGYVSFRREYEETGQTYMHGLGYA